VKAFSFIKMNGAQSVNDHALSSVARLACHKDNGRAARQHLVVNRRISHETGDTPGIK
jgi:hypothetical protein